MGWQRQRISLSELHLVVHQDNTDTGNYVSWAGQACNLQPFPGALSLMLGQADLGLSRSFRSPSGVAKGGLRCTRHHLTTAPVS